MKSLENTCHNLSASEVMIHEEALSQVYVPLLFLPVFTPSTAISVTLGLVLPACSPEITQARHVHCFGLVVNTCPPPFRLAASVLWCWS